MPSPRLDRRPGGHRRGDRDGQLRASDRRADVVQPGLQLGLGQSAPLSAPHLRCLVDGASRISHHLALDAGARSPSQVGSQGLAVASAQVVRMVPGEGQHSLAKPGHWQNAHQAPAEILVESSPGRRPRQNHVFRRGPQEERDQRGEARRSARGCGNESCQRARTGHGSAKWQATCSREPRPPVPNPGIWPPVYHPTLAVAVARPSH